MNLFLGGGLKEEAPGDVCGNQKKRSFFSRRNPIFSRRKIEPEDTTAMIVRHVQHRFASGDTLCVPAGWEAVGMSEGAVISVWREGDEPALGKAFKKGEGDLYFVRLTPDSRLDWGRGGVSIGGKNCGIHGTMRLETVSSRKLLSAFLNGRMPVSAEQVFDRIVEPALDIICGEVRALALSHPLQGLEALAAKQAKQALDDMLEEFGMAATALTIEEIFIAPDAQVEEA